MKLAVCFFFLWLPFMHAEEQITCKVRLLGAVTRPADYELSDGKTDLFTLIEKAGGIGQSARGGQGVEIKRTVSGKVTETRIKINVAALMKEGIKSPLNLKIRNGDTITILQRVF